MIRATFACIETKRRNEKNIERNNYNFRVLQEQAMARASEKEWGKSDRVGASKIQILNEVCLMKKLFICKSVNNQFKLDGCKENR